MLGLIVPLSDYHWLLINCQSSSLSQRSHNLQLLTVDHHIQSLEQGSHFSIDPTQVLHSVRLPSGTSFYFPTKLPRCRSQTDWERSNQRWCWSCHGTRSVSNFLCHRLFQKDSETVWLSECDKWSLVNFLGDCQRSTVRDASQIFRSAYK